MSSTFLTYLELGFDHILDLNGYDHILFIVALCAVYKLSEWKQVAILVTAFTIGHSITLALAALDLIRLPSNWVEFLIPVTIVMTAIYNIIRSNGHSENLNSKIQTNYLLALLFGLIHGLGFSNFFRAMTLPGEENQFIFQLLSFNIGVELGQLIIVAIILAASFLALNLLKLKQKYWNWLISSMAGVWALSMAWERGLELFA